MVSLGRSHVTALFSCCCSLRTSFQGTTVIVVAHRLNTILDSDKVLVLDAGKIVEMGSPSDLLANPAGAFRTLYDAQRQH